MLTTPTHPDVTGRLDTARAGALLDHVVATAREYDQPVHAESPGRVELDTGIGRIRLRANDRALHIRISAATEANAFMLRESVVARIEGVDAALLGGLAWSDALPERDLPPNFRAGRVVGVAPLGPAFWRLEVEAPDLAAFAREGIHLRLVLPPRGRPPAWPGVDASGRVRWPEGPDAPHVAVYTIRRVDPETGRMTLDAYRHGRGPTCAWLAHARPGDAVGLMGPGGGWMPDARHLTLAGDETALPAIARILEDAAPGTTGTALLETADRAGELPVAAPPGIALHRLSRAAGERLEDALDALPLGPEGARHVWFAAEKRRAGPVRRRLREERGLARGEVTVAGYWVDR